ncbi:DMT family transporter [Brevibacillus fluminis]|uniref:DMT family transporter n=1 Tax=Brevibacillus fluminis TaxID=511487 RepID=UPI003F8C45A9
MGREKYVYGLLVGVIAIWGLNVVMVKYLSFFPPVLIAAIRMTVAALVLVPVIYWQKEKVSIGRKGWFLIIGAALFSIVFHQTLLANGITSTTAGNTSLLLGLNPLVTSLLAVPLLGEKLTGRKLIGVLLGFGGVLLVVLSRENGQVGLSGWGDALVFFSMISYVLGGLVIRAAAKHGVPTIMITVYSQIIAAVLLWVIAAIIYPWSVFSSINTEPFTWLVILASGIFATGLGALGWNYGIRRLGASRTAIFLNGMPFASLIFAAILLGEQLQWVHGVAVVLIVAGVYLGIKQPQSERDSQVIHAVRTNGSKTVPLIK